MLARQFWTFIILPMRIHLPLVLVMDHHVHGQWLRRAVAPARTCEGQITPFSRDAIRGVLFIPDADTEPEVLIVDKALTSYADRTHVVKASVHTDRDTLDLSRATWLLHPDITGEVLSVESIRESWIDAFRYRLESRNEGRFGLRPPQLGAVHAVLAHWAVSNSVATVVMPTGTGKTDTMASILVAGRCERTLVIVPSDALRTQLAEKFLNLGLLTVAPGELLAESAHYPTVAVLKKLPKTVQELDEVLEQAHVVVTTSHLVTRCAYELQARLAHWCPYLFIDEAHHAEASTWRSLRNVFANRRVLQMTATPFREDGKLLEGTIVFRYRLRQAYEDGYFQPIRLVAISQYIPELVDRAIAERAVAELRASLDRGHVLMARASTVARARQIYGLYCDHKDLHPVQLHTGQGVTERRQVRQQIISGQARIIVCVDMLGEGFDLPQLKIAAFHDVRKSLPVTLQLIGRFTRTGKDLGEAVAIANTADIQVRGELERLYRDGDWNILLPEIADGIVDERMALQNFLKGFDEFDGDVSLQQVNPTSSTVVYRTSCANWKPENFRSGLTGHLRRERLFHAINVQRHTLVVISANRGVVPWAEDTEIFDRGWELMVAAWCPDKQLLFIHASSLSGNYRKFACAVTGPEAKLICGQEVFRVFAGIARLQLQNVGLKEQLGRNVRYTGRMGSDAGPVITELDRRKASKALLGGTGFEGGAKVTIGASAKGRIWSMRRVTLNQFVLWCEHIGAKLIDPSLDPDNVLSGTLKTTYVTLLPAKVPIYIGWPELVYAETEHGWMFTTKEGLSVGLHELEIKPAAFETNGQLEIDVLWLGGSTRLQLLLTTTGEDSDFRFVHVDGPELDIGRSSSVNRESLTTFFTEDPPTCWFADGSSLEGNRYIELRDVGPSFSIERIECWDWQTDGVDIKKESYIKSVCGCVERRTDSIQYHVIQRLIAEGGYRVIIDDDDHGEAADIVAVRVVDDEEISPTIEVEFYHCKFSLSSEPGARIKDLYEVCGQTQKSVSWAASHEKKRELFSHLLRRDALRAVNAGVGRIELGDTAVLEEIYAMSGTLAVSMQMILVQPGLSRSKASRSQLELLGSTENYLAETYQIPLRVIGSA